MMYVTSLSVLMPATVTSGPPLPPSRLIRSFDDRGTIRVARPSSTDLVLFPSLSLGGKGLRLAAPGLPLSQDVRLRYKVPGDRTVLQTTVSLAAPPPQSTVSRIRYSCRARSGRGTHSLTTYILSL